MILFLPGIFRLLFWEDKKFLLDFVCLGGFCIKRRLLVFMYYIFTKIRRRPLSHWFSFLSLNGICGAWFWEWDLGFSAAMYTLYTHTFLTSFNMLRNPYRDNVFKRLLWLIMDINQRTIAIYLRLIFHCDIKYFKDFRIFY